MKTIRIFILAIFTAFAVVNADVAKAQVEVGADVTFSVFHDNLAGYGRWVNHPSYGQVWVSNEASFVPYRTNGHWAYTDDGWTWVSDYEWGWAPFHYGRWDYDAAYGGYYWVPGYEWGPAWVSWRRDNANYGWAPLRPGISVGIGVSFGVDIASERWTFVPNRYITSPYVNRYYVPASRNTIIIRNTTIINNAHNNGNRVVVVGGPQRREVEQFTHTKVNVYAVANSSRPGRGVVAKNTINIYRPVVNKTTVINKTVINQKNTVVNNNNKTVVNNNSNNKVVNNNSKVNVKNNTVNNKTTVNNNQKKEVVNNKTVVKKPAPKPADNVAKKPVQQVNKPKQPVRPAVKARPQQQKPQPKKIEPKDTKQPEKQPA